MSKLFLAIETSTPIGSIAVGDGSRVLSEIVLGERSRHSEMLLPAIDFALSAAGVVRNDVAGVVVAGGPGSFTGLRIAAASAKAFAHALEIPLFAYSGLCALAASTAQHKTAVCALFDARRGEVYSAVYRFPDFTRVETLLEPAPRHIDELLGITVVRDTIFVGDGALQNAAVIQAAGGTVAPSHFAVPRASALLWLQQVAPTAGKIEDLAAWEPLYLRESGAERMKAR